MKLLTLFFLCSLFFAVSCSSNKSSKHIFTQNFYPDGKLKEVVSLDQDSLKDGLVTYFDTFGTIKMTEEYKKGKLNGDKIIYDNDRTHKYYYQNHSLLFTSWYDTTGELKYQFPVDTSKLFPLKIFFKNGNNYLDKTKNDTVRIVVAGLPLGNQVLNISETVMSRIGNSDWYIIYAVDKYSNANKVKLVVSYKNDLNDDDSKIIRYDSTVIPVR